MLVRIVIPFFKDYDTIESCIRSILDQDYKEREIIVVQDGADPEAENLLTKLHEQLDHSFIYTILPENKGASGARNHGALFGDFPKCNNAAYFFMDADCSFYPGMLRELVTQLSNNDDLTFVYGNHRVEHGKYPSFISQPFDPYLLETMNYIPTMALVRAKAFVYHGGFDEELAYFQDWDLWYRLVCHGFKGKWVNEFIFSTAVVDENSISGKPGLNLAEKASKFRRENLIIDKEIVVTTWGAPLQAIQRAKMLNADYVGPAIEGSRLVFPINYQFPQWKATYMVGVFNETVDQLQNHFQMTLGKPIYHFIGTDVFHLMNYHPVAMLKKIQESFEKQNAHVFVNSSRMLQELTDCHIKAELLYTPVYNIGKYKSEPLPANFTVGVYYSDSNPMHSLPGTDAYQRSLQMNTSNMAMVVDVAKSMPDIAFKFFGGHRTGQEDNIEFCGRIPEDQIVEFINSCSITLRCTVHDGFPQLPIQFALCGRQALVTCPDAELKFCEKLSFEDITQYETNKSEIINALYYMSNVKYDPAQRSKEAHDYYSELMSEAKFMKRIYEVAGV